MVWATPAGFVPGQEQGYARAGIRLPPGSSIQQTDAVLKKVVKKLLDVPGTEAAVMFAGFDGASGTQASHAGAAYVTFKPFAARAGTPRPARNIAQAMPAAPPGVNATLASVIPPPRTPGPGTGGGT